MEEAPRKVIGVIGDSKPYRKMELIGNGQKSTLKSALSDLGWDISAPLQIEPLPLGLSNFNYKVSCGGHGPLLLRVFGPKFGEQNPDERHIQDSGFGANTVLEFEWGRLETWLPGQPMQREDCDNSQVLAALANELSRLHTETGRNHNDLNFTNILVCNSEEHPVTHLLDFEYAGPLDPPFDIANFFCEWMYDCGSLSWFEPEPAHFPSEEQARSFIALYLGGIDSTGSEVSDFLKEVRTRIPSVHTFWINWAMKYFSDRDEYVQYAERRQLLFSCNPLRDLI